MRLAVLGSAVAVLAVVGGGVVAGVVAQDDVTAAQVDVPADAVAVPMQVWSDEYGVAVRMRTALPGVATLGGAVLLAGTEEVEGNLWPLDGKDHEGEDDTAVPLAADGRVEVIGALSPDCARTAALGPVVFRMVSRTADGAVEPISFVAADPDPLSAAVAEWCASGPLITPTGAMSDPSGYREVYLEVTNPGPGPIEVTLPAGGGWEASSITVPAGELRVPLTLRGTDVDCDPGAATSWAGGRLLIDGEPFPVALHDSPCGG